MRVVGLAALTVLLASERVSSPMELRPALWKGAGEQVIVANYTPAAIAGAISGVAICPAPVG